MKNFVLILLFIIFMFYLRVVGIYLFVDMLRCDIIMLCEGIMFYVCVLEFEDKAYFI